MIRLKNSLAMAATAALLLTTTAATAGTRPGSAMPMVSTAVTDQMGTRVSKRVKAKERVVGLPLALIIVAGVGASAAAVAALTKNNNRHDSRG